MKGEGRHEGQAGKEEMNLRSIMNNLVELEIK